MALDETNVIDATGTDRETGEFVLTIIDGWDWKAEAAHLLALQAKLNAYFGFVEAGQISEIEPKWREAGARIDVIFRHDPPPQAIAMLKTAEFMASLLGLKVAQKTVL